jgi:predicted RNase H-like HicB family nuclease
MNQRYAVVIEQGESSFGAWVPDLPGCVAVGETAEEVEALIREAIQFHIEGMREKGEKVPPARIRVTSVAISA